MLGDLVQGFSETDAKRIRAHVERLLPYLTPGKFTIVGGLAIRYHLITHTIEYPQREFNDIDITVTSLDAVSPRVIDEFLVEHYHPPVNNSFYLVLIDPVTKTKIDIFSAQVPEDDTREVSFGKYKIQITTPECQLVKTVFDLQRISQEKKVDPKQFSDARLLLRIVDKTKAEAFWQKKGFTSIVLTLMEALEKAEKVAHVHPDWVKEKPFRRKIYICPDCVDSAVFPLTPMKKIYSIMGYIE